MADYSSPPSLSSPPNPPLMQQKPLLLPLFRAFVILSSILVFACVIWMIAAARQSRLAEEHNSSENLAATLAQHAEDTIKTADVILLGLVERLEVDGQDAQYMPRLQRFMKSRIEEFADLQSLLVIDRHGNWLVSSYGGQEVGHDNSDRAYFRWHQEHADNLVHISPPIPGRTSGDWVIPVTRRLNNSQGNFDGVVVATVRVDYFQQIYRTLDIKYHGFISLSLADGTVLVREPSGADSSLNSSALPEEQASGSLNRLENGRKRLYSYYRLSHYPLMVITAQAQDEVLASWQNEALLQVTVVVILLLLLNLFGFYLIHLIKAELNTHQVLQQARDALSEQRLQLEKFALEDELTGLANRRHLMNCLTQEVQRAIRYRHPVSLLMLDVDWFKQYNDRYGHNAGDKGLREVAQALKHGQNRVGDLAARYGGEEFCLLLPGAYGEGAARIGEKVRSALEQRAIAHEDSPFGVLSISIGVHSLYPQPGGAAEAAECLLQCADAALYQAKREGRNQVLLYQNQQGEADETDKSTTTPTDQPL